jgi:hypothetical protein
MAVGQERIPVPDWSNARVSELSYVSSGTAEEGDGHYVVMATPPNGSGIHRRPIRTFDTRAEAQAYATAQNKFWSGSSTKVQR